MLRLYIFNIFILSFNSSYLLKNLKYEKRAKFGRIFCSLFNNVKFLVYLKVLFDYLMIITSNQTKLALSYLIISR